MAEFQHINKGALEKLFESDLTRNLFQYQNTIIKELLKKKEKYNLLRNNFMMKSGGNNLSLIDEILTFDSGGVFSVIRNYNGISYNLGANMALQEFKSESTTNLNQFQKLDVIAESQEVLNRVEKLYKSTIKNILLNGVILKKAFPTFIKEVQSVFSKSKSVKKVNSRNLYLPDFPIIKDVVNNVKISMTTKSFVSGMVDVFKDSGKVQELRYQTQEDEKVSSKCRKWHGEVLPANKIDGIIPQHLNCRCRWVPDT